MGSFQEFQAAINFVDKHKIRPIVHKTVHGLENADEAFETMKNGDQFGKLVIKIADSDEGSPTKL